MENNKMVPQVMDPKTGKTKVFPGRVRTPTGPDAFKITSMKDDSKLLAKLPITQAHLNTIKKNYGIK